MANFFGRAASKIVSEMPLVVCAAATGLIGEKLFLSGENGGTGQSNSAISSDKEGKSFLLDSANGQKLYEINKVLGAKAQSRE